METKVQDDVGGLKALGSKQTAYPNESGADPSVLESFPNKFPGREYNVVFTTSEFTSLCPKTGQPDFASIYISYVPDETCIESKGLKLYLFSYRSERSFMETITNRILTDLVTLVKPKKLYVEGNFAARGGIGTRVRADYTRDGGVKVTMKSSGSPE